MAARRTKVGTSGDLELGKLARIVANARGGRARSLSSTELLELPRLYRYAASKLSEVATRGGDEAGAARLNDLVARAHQILFAGLDRANEPFLRRAARYVWSDVPAALRSEWKLLALNAAVLYGLSTAAFFAVRGDLDLAYSLFDPGTIADEIRQLEATAAGEPFRGNFTFGIGKSSSAAGYVMGNNMRVGVVFFASALVPPLYLFVLTTNSLMLGAYTGVASHWGQAGAISSILWCHGVLEIQAIVIAGTAGLVLARAWIAPGPWSRKHAMAIESSKALKLLAATFPLLFFAGLIEGFVSPHAPFAVRIATAIGTGVLLVAWILLGRERATAEPDAKPARG